MLNNIETNSLGKIEIAPEVIQVISGHVVTGMKGVFGFSGGVVDDIGEFLGRKNLKKGVRVELGEKISIGISVVLNFGVNIPDLAKDIQGRVKDAVETMTSLLVDQVRVNIEGIRFPDAGTEVSNNNS